MKRNTVSHYLNKEVGKSLFKVNTRPVLFFDAKVFEERFFKPEKPVYASLEELFMEHTEAERKSREADDPLESMIGARGSLKKAIEQIKTSVFYPNTSLPVFLHGDTGPERVTWPGRFMSFLSVMGTSGRGAVHHAELCPVRQQCGVVVQQSVRICKRSVYRGIRYIQGTFGGSRRRDAVFG